MSASDDQEHWSLGERLLEDIGLGNLLDRDRRDHPVDDVATAALQTPGGHVLLCPLEDVDVNGGDDGHALTSDAWVSAHPRDTVLREEYR